MSGKKLLLPPRQSRHGRTTDDQRLSTQNLAILDTHCDPHLPMPGLHLTFARVWKSFGYSFLLDSFMLIRDAFRFLSEADVLNSRLLRKHGLQRHVRGC